MPDSEYKYDWNEDKVIIDGGPVWFAMLMRSPMSPQLSIVWMLLLGSMPVMLRAEREAKDLVMEKGRTSGTLFELYRAQFGVFIIIPISLLMSSLALFAMAVGFVYMLIMYELMLVWVVLIFVVLVRVPVDIFWAYLGIEVEPADFKGFEDDKIRRALMAIGSSKYFKYYFTASLQVAGVALQIYVAFDALNNLKRVSQPEVFTNYLAGESSRGTLAGKLMEDFFTLTTEPYSAPNVSWDFFKSLSVSFPLLDARWWSSTFNFGIFEIPDLALDLKLMFVFNLAYFFSFLFLAAETVFAILEEWYSDANDADASGEQR